VCVSVCVPVFVSLSLSVCVCVCVCVCQRQGDRHSECAKQAGRLESVGKTVEYVIDEYQGGGWEALCCAAQERQYSSTALTYSF
jgi:hypothetical protein